ncbi:iron ABC transporter permease [Gordonia sp. HY002]|uniref:FecCD family ABC transporter permease n=1 Tax=Gordonia zhenghanii TaxID=2911516 RepID=UPI001EF093D4|nr:iron ABC transporter permease [Gordonia zhenghanii]MCF8572080.1 iron ABC transporter permease [Gordonia zhenghanii]MCF8602954.1 iron ABC transporter permease [Gordonia zhenghanii]
MTTVEVVKAGRRARSRRRALLLAALIALVVIVFFVSLMVGQRFYPLGDVIDVILGRPVSGGSFTVGELRLPRACMAVLSGFAFGFAGVTFQTLLRNPLASPDIIGISWGASAAAVVAIVIFGLTGTSVSVVALLGALVAAAAVYGLSMNSGFSATRLILIGIGIAAMLSSVVSYVLARAADWDIANALLWITGSLAEPDWGKVTPLAVVVAVVAPIMLTRSRDMNMLSLGDDAAAGMGVRVEGTRVLVIVGAVILLGFATAGTGPISFVAFMSGPIAMRLFTRAGGSMLLPAGLVGALLVSCADLVAQFALPHRYPVGVVTGVLGAPFLIYLLIRVNRSGGTL